MITALLAGIVTIVPGVGPLLAGLLTLVGLLV